VSDATLAGDLLQLLGVDVSKLGTPTRDEERVLVIDRRAVERPRRVSRGPSPGQAVVVHQTDCEFGVSPGQLKAAGGNVFEARLQRLMATPYHVVAMLARAGAPACVLLNHPAELRMSHASRGNGGLGLGIEGRFPTLASGSITRRTPIADAIEVGRTALRFAVAMAGGGSIEVQAHRQWSRDRTRDPGEEVWRQIVLPVVAELGLWIDYERRDVGRPIPREWDGAAEFDLAGLRLPTPPGPR
jgi:hypothetical protein